MSKKSGVGSSEMTFLSKEELSLVVGGYVHVPYPYPFPFPDPLYDSCVAAYEAKGGTIGRKIVGDAGAKVGKEVGTLIGHVVCPSPCIPLMPKPYPHFVLESA